MNIFLQSLDDRDCAPTRWNWDYHLLKACDLLDSTDIGKKLFAHVVCLNLSCATGDDRCISGVAHLHKLGLLTPQSMMKAPVSKISRAIRKCGMHNVKGKQLKDMATVVSKKYKGIVPCDFDVLCSLAGYDRKTTLLINAHRGVWLLQWCST